MTSPLSKRSRACNSVGGGKRTCNVVRRARCEAGSRDRGFGGLSVSGFAVMFGTYGGFVVVGLVVGGGFVARVLRREVKNVRGVGRGE